MITESKFGRTHPANTTEQVNFVMVLGCSVSVDTCCRGGMYGLVLMCKQRRSFLQLLSEAY